MENPIEDLYEGKELPKIDKKKIALLCIDLQYHDAAVGYGFFKNSSREDYKYYFDRLDDKVFPAVKRLQELFREENLEIIHARIESLTSDGRDRSLEHKRIGCHVPKGSKASQIIDEVEPKRDEIVLSKTASGVFNSTNIEYILKNIGIEQLVIVGVLTNECVETTVRDAADKGYVVYMVEEGMAAFNEALHNNSLKVLNGVYGYLVSEKKLTKMIKNK